MINSSTVNTFGTNDFFVGSFNIWFSLFVFVSLFSSGLYELKNLLLNDNKDDEIKKEIKETLLYILFIASSAYAFISYSFISSGFETFETRNIRYLDWIVTTPLLTYTAYLFVSRRKQKEVCSKNSPFFLNKLLTLNLLFVAFGIVSEYTTRSYSFQIGVFLSLISFIFYGFYLYYLYQLLNSVEKTKQIKVIKAFFFVGWTFYGIVFALDFLKIVDRKIIVFSYSCLDIINKIMYSFVLNSFIKHEKMDFKFY